MAVPPPNAGYLVNLTPDDDVVMRDLVIQAWLAEIVSAVNSGGGGGGLSPIAAYSTLANNTAATAVPVASQFLMLGTPSITDTGVELQLTGSTNGYLQSILQNTSNGATASADYIVNNDQGTSTTHYGDFGINSSGFTGTGNFNAAGATYLYSSNGDLSIGSITGNSIHFIAGSATASDVMTIAPSTTTATAVTIANGLSVGGTAYAYGAPSITGATALLVPATTYSVTGGGSYANFQAEYHGVPTFNTLGLGATVTDLFSAMYAGPAIASGNVTGIRTHTFGILDSTSAATSVTGAFVVATAFGTGATSVGIGGGNVNAGGTLTVGGASTLLSLTVQNGTSLGGTAYSFGALPSGATTSGTVLTVPPTTYTVTGTNTATAFQANYFGVPTFTNVSAGVVTDLFGSVFAGPAAVAGSQTATRAHTVGILDSTVSSNAITGGLVVATAFGTAATSVGIGAGNINLGNNLTVGGSGNSTGNFTFQANIGVHNQSQLGNTAYSMGALPSGANTSAAVIQVPAITYTVTGTNTATTFQANYFGQSTFTNVGAGVITDLFNSLFVGPALVAGSQTATRSHTFGVNDSTSAASSITGALVVATTFGTAATSVGIGGGNINAGGTVTAGGLVTASAGITVGGATYAGTVVLTAGAGTITSAAITTSSVIVLTLKTASGANTYPQILANAGTATITGLGTDAGTYNWRLIT